MAEITQTVSVTLVEFAQLTFLEGSMFERAINARLNAQAPYSHHAVGCCVCALDADKELQLFPGCNVERDVYDGTTHAERNAVDSMIAAIGPSPILKVAVVGAQEDVNVIWPPKPSMELKHFKVSDFCPACGGCLQVILENCFDETGAYNPNVELMGYKAQLGILYKTTIGQALPMPFAPAKLGINYAQYIAKRRETRAFL